MSDEARAKVETILQEAGVTFSAVYLGEQKTGFDKSQPWQCDKYSCAFTKGAGRGANGEEFDYWMGIGNREIVRGFKALKMPGAQHIKGHWQASKPKPPHPADLLHSLILDSSAAEQTFSDWCSDFGYDTDSRKAFATYEACQENTNKLRAVFTRAQLEALREALQDY